MSKCCPSCDYDWQKFLVSLRLTCTRGLSLVIWMRLAGGKEQAILRQSWPCPSNYPTIWRRVGGGQATVKTSLQQSRGWNSECLGTSNCLASRALGTVESDSKRERSARVPPAPTTVRSGQLTVGHIAPRGRIQVKGGVNTFQRFAQPTDTTCWLSKALQSQNG